MGRRRAVRTLNRTIRFFRAKAGKDDANVPLILDPENALRHIDTLQFNADGRYLVLGAEEAVTCCWVYQPTPRQRIRLVGIRRTDLPEVENAGRLIPLNIPATSGLAEAIHVVFFANNIVGADFNFYGPRVSRLGTYLGQKAPGLAPPVVFEPLLRQDVMQQLGRLRDIRLFQLKVHRSYIDTIAQADSDLGSAFRAAADAGGADEVEIVLSPKPYSREPIGRRLLAPVRRLARRSDLRDNAARFHVKGLDPQTNRTELVDVLQDQFVVSRQLVRLNNRTRAVDPTSAFDAIEDAYEGIKTELEEAAGVQV